MATAAILFAHSALAWLADDVGKHVGTPAVQAKRATCSYTVLTPWKRWKYSFETMLYLTGLSTV